MSLDIEVHREGEYRSILHIFGDGTNVFGLHIYFIFDSDVDNGKRGKQKACEASPMICWNTL